MSPENHGESIVVFTPDTARDIGRKVAIEEIESPLLRQAIDSWNRLRGSRRYPAREEMSPRTMKRFLRNVSLFRVLEGGTDFEWRVMGDAAVVAYGRSYQGMKTADMDAVQPGMGSVIKRVCGSVAKSGAPLAFHGRLLKGRDSLLYQETVMLPLGPEGGPVDAILVIGSYTPRPLETEGQES